MVFKALDIAHAEDIFQIGYKAGLKAIEKAGSFA
jgi:hypothetical protein